ncbi:MAG: hypothetical protein WBP89_14935 [Sedimenticolaceae bacterium]
MLTIDKLEIQFDVEGDDSEVFARLFARHIAHWEQEQAEQRRGRSELQRDSAIGGMPMDEDC